ncbi:hypothetical protein KKE14_01370 [Patescibacteria group bacterium]|nr:hypothetical protein [Patescibacteria group bacterium]
MKEKDCGGGCCGHMFKDWFYTVLLLVVGLILLMINLGFVDSGLIAYWPLLLVMIGLKELLDRH